MLQAAEVESKSKAYTRQHTSKMAENEPSAFIIFPMTPRDETKYV